MSHLRPAAVSDAESLGRLHVRSWQVAHREFLPSSYLDGLVEADRIEGWRARLLQPQGEREIQVVEEGGRVQGFVSFGPSRDADAAAGSAELYALYLDPDGWGRGLGRALFEWCREAARARRFGELTLWVLRQNAHARGFYAHMQMRPDGATKTVVREGVQMNEVRYRLDL